MVLDDQDKQDLKKMMVETFNEGLEQVVMPVLTEVLETVTELKIDVTELKSDVAELKETTARIERVQHKEVERADRNERRIDTLEAGKQRVAV